MSSADVNIFSAETGDFYYIKKYDYRLHFNTEFLILLTLLESLKVVLVSMVAILIMLAKLATLVFLKIKVFGNKGHDVIIYVLNVSNKIYLVAQIIL